MRSEMDTMVGIAFDERVLLFTPLFFFSLCLWRLFCVDRLLSLLVDTVFVDRAFNDVFPLSPSRIVDIMTASSRTVADDCE